MSCSGSVKGSCIYPLSEFDFKSLLDGQGCARWNRRIGVDDVGSDEFEGARSKAALAE